MEKIKNNRTEMSYACFAKALPIMAVAVIFTTALFGYVIHGCKMPNQSIPKEQIIIIVR